MLYHSLLLVFCSLRRQPLQWVAQCCQLKENTAIFTISSKGANGCVPILLAAFYKNVLNLDLDHDLNLFRHTFRFELARINPINIETIWYS